MERAFWADLCLQPLRCRQPFGKFDFRRRTTVSDFLAPMANVSFPRNPKSAFHFPPGFMRFRRMSAMCLLESVAGELGDFFNRPAPRDTSLPFRFLDRSRSTSRETPTADPHSWWCGRGVCVGWRLEGRRRRSLNCRPGCRGLPDTNKRRANPALVLSLQHAANTDTPQ
jgi:hypothetical protein